VHACCRSAIEWLAFSPKGPSACGNGMDRLDAAQRHQVFLTMWNDATLALLGSHR